MSLKYCSYLKKKDGSRVPGVEFLKTMGMGLSQSSAIHWLVLPERTALGISPIGALLRWAYLSKYLSKYRDRLTSSGHGWESLGKQWNAVWRDLSAASQESDAWVGSSMNGRTDGWRAGSSKQRKQWNAVSVQRETLIYYYSEYIFRAPAVHLPKLKLRSRNAVTWLKK